MNRKVYIYKSNEPRLATYPLTLDTPDRGDGRLLALRVYQPGRDILAMRYGEKNWDFLSYASGELADRSDLVEVTFQEKTAQPEPSNENVVDLSWSISE